MLLQNKQLYFLQFIYFSALLAKATLATFGGLRHYWANCLLVDPDDPYMTFDPSMRYTPVRGSSYQI